MKFVDETEVAVIGGNGGRGIVSFLRERGKPRGGPNGGDGGRGGDVKAVAARQMKTLLDIARRRRITAGNGGHGGGNNKHGGGGEDAVMQVPIGTRISDADTGCLHADLIKDGQECVLAHGGRGGMGNTRFKSATNRAPRRATEGESGEARRYRFELRLLADVGLLGMPNAGKSSLLRALSAARPKVASYPFTTMTPQLGVIRDSDGTMVTVADVPGLIRGAAEGAGLGIRFLRHLSRTALLCHVVDIAAEDPAGNCADLHAELEASAPPLFQKAKWLILNKSDLLSVKEKSQIKQEMQKRFPNFAKVHIISAVTGAGVRALAGDLLDYERQLEEARQEKNGK